MEPGKRYAQVVEKTFHISKACLDLQASGNEPVSVYLDTENKKFLLCVLQKSNLLQTSLDLNFMAGDKIAFFTVGKGRIHLTGYLHDTEEDLDDTALSEEESEGSEVEDKIIKEIEDNKTKKRKEQAQSPKTNAKKQKLEESDEGDSDLAMSDLEDEEDEDEDDEVDESDEMEVEEPIKQSPPKKNKKKQKENNATPAEQKNAAKLEKAGGATPKVQTPQLNGTPNVHHQSGKKNKKKDGETPATPKSPLSPQTPGQTPQKRTLEGGVAIEDVKVGNGPVAKPGKFVTVYYTGRLKQNNKQFDATNQGPGFKFRLGKGEVIKGWDIGLNGMRIGGKRKIVIPPHMAYGTKGSPPVIPPNSALVFDVELRHVN